jgi:virulence factor Mce-like protein
VTPVTVDRKFSGVVSFEGSGKLGMRLTGDLIVRAAALAAVLVVAVVVAVLLLGSAGGGYKVKARFQNAAQLVKGNLVQTGGAPVGTVENIDLTANGEAEITMKISDDYAPLRRGTLATIRQASLSGIANRYIDLRMAPQSAEKIPENGVLEQDATTTAVDLDQVFNTFDPETRKALSGVLHGSAAQFKDKGKQFNEGIAYLNPSLAASSRLFRELNRDTPLLERFIVSSSQLVTDIADRHDDLAGLVDEQRLPRPARAVRRPRGQEHLPQLRLQALRRRGRALRGQPGLPRGQGRGLRPGAAGLLPARRRSELRRRQEVGRSRRPGRCGGPPRRSP